MPLQLTLAIMNVICFVLWALVTELYGWFGAGLAFALIAIVFSFASALAATNVLMLPQYVSNVQRANVESRSPFVNKAD